VADIPASEIEDVFREQYGRAVSVLVRSFGDIDVAEEAVQDAEPGRLDHHHRPQPGHRPAPPGGVA
jgi:RNA polymerase sigma-70 factor (ECF subfamily)